MNENQSKTKKLILFKDQPETENLKFAHSILVEWIHDAIKNSPRPFRLAITRSLGAGKSTIVNGVKKKLENEDGFITSTVDVWKLDEKSSRRSACIKIAEDLGLKPKEIEGLKEDLYGTSSDFSRAKSHKTFVDKTSLLTWIFVSIVFGILAYFLLGFAKGDSDLTFRFGISFFTMLLTLSLKLIDRTFVTVQRTFNRSPLVGAEEFESSLRKIVDNEKIRKKKILLVFDNIDRASFSKTQEILSGISAFFDHESNRNKNLVILVPFSQGQQEDLSPKTIHKFFDGVLAVPELVPEDLTDYTDDLLNRTNGNFETKGLAELITFGPYSTPRDLKHFINKFISAYNLSLRMEFNINDAGEPYLAKGTISDHPLTLAKLMIINDIAPGILALSVKHHLSIENIFNFKTLSEVLLEPQLRSKLEDFLIATEGLPKNFPTSADPFLYFKGADILVNIPGAQELAKSLSEGKINQIKEYLSEQSDDKVKNMHSIIQFTFKRYRGNDQRIRNTISVILNSFDAALPVNLRTAVATELRKHEGFIKDLKIQNLNKVTPANEQGEISNVHIWINLDKIYHTLIASKDTLEENYDWVITYLTYVLVQKNGLSRSKIDAENFHLSFLFESKVIEAMAKKYPCSLVSKSHIIEFLKNLVKNNYLGLPEISASKVSTLVLSGMSQFGEEITTETNEAIRQIWLLISSQINKPEFDRFTFHSIIGLFNGIPEEQKHSWSQISNQFNTSHTVFSNKFNSGFKAEVIGLICSLNRKVKITTLTNFKNTVAVSYIKNLDLEAVKELYKIFDSWDWINDISEFAKNEFLAFLQSNEEIIEYLYVNSSGAMATFMRDEFVNFKDTEIMPNTIDKLETESDLRVSKKDLVSAILKSPSDMPFRLRDKAMNFCAELDIPTADLDSLIDFELEHNTDIDRTHDLISLLTSMSSVFLNGFVNKAGVLIKDFEGETFRDIHFNQFFVSTLNFSTDTDTFLWQLVDIALQKGVVDNLDSDICIRIIERIFEILEYGKLADKKYYDTIQSAIEKSSALKDESEKFIDDLKLLKKNVRSLI